MAPKGNTASSPTLLPKGEEEPPATISEIIYSHFDAHQHNGETDAITAVPSAKRAAKSLLGDISSAAGEDGGTGEGVNEEEISNAIVRVLDSAMSTVASSSKNNNYTESVGSVLELAAAFACSTSGTAGASNKNKEEQMMAAVAKAVIDRAVGYTTVDRDAIRLEGCKLLELCVRNLLIEGGNNKSSTTSILKNKKRGKNKEQVEGEKSVGGAALSAWRVECLQSASNALLPRVTDKISKVRNAAISACSPILGASKLLSGEAQGEAQGELEEVMSSIQASLRWILSNDPSAPNRASVARLLPASSSGEEENIAAIIDRIKDVDVKVREAALENVKNVNFFTEGEEGLAEDRRVEILRNGLTKRCPTTYAKTVELLCCSWLKSTRFDPLALLDKLNPVLNENVCEQVSRVLILVASTIDCESGVEGGVELVQKQLSGPEVRTLQQSVMKRMNIIDAAAQATAGDDEGEDGEKNAKSLSPSLALFLRVKCDESAKKSESISDIITDIPTLCNLLNSHIDRLIEFNTLDEHEDMDDDEAAVYEDSQNFICLQLIHMAQSSELQEEGSRRHFISIMRRVLSRLATPDDLVEECVKAMAAAHDRESQFLQTISEILVDVEDDDTFQNGEYDEKAIIIVRQMRLIAILSIVLESLTVSMVGHPILDSFFQHLSPAITSKNAIVREHGVICLSKFCLLSEEEKVGTEFIPLLMTIAGSVEERVEVRARAALALCDLALIHEKMVLGDNSGEGKEEESSGGGSNGSNSASSLNFKDMLLEMLGHSKPGIVIIAAEITAKLLLAGRLNDPELVAWLLFIYFDTSLAADFDENDIDGVEVKEVGSPVRLQQLLSIFFPTYSMSSLDANDDLMASVCPLLSIVNLKLSTGQMKDGKEALARFPIAKMIEYVCYTVDLADKKKKNEETANESSSGGEAKDEVKTVASSEGQAVESSEEDGVEDGGENNVEDSAPVANSDNDKAAPEKDEEVVVEASSTLLASIDVAEFLSEECDNAPTFYNRALAKILGSAVIDVDAEDKALLRRLKSHVNEAEYANDDGPTVKSIKKLSDLLVDVADAASDDEESVSSEEESVANDLVNDKEEEVAGEEESLEKENARMSIGSVKSATKQIDEGGVNTSQRMSLGSVNAN